MARVHVRRLPRVPHLRHHQANIPRFRDTYGNWWIEVDGLEATVWARPLPAADPRDYFGSGGCSTASANLPWGNVHHRPSAR